MISAQAPRPRVIAMRILTWTVCSFRPLELAELEVALENEFGSFPSLRDTITQTYGNFVVVEKSRVVPIHDTARDSLLHRTAGLPLTISPGSGHANITDVCLRYLMDPVKNWKRTFSRESPGYWDGRRKRDRSVFFDSYPFLSYSITWWSYHASLAILDSRLVTLVFEFFSRSCLLWIQGIALLGDMTVLIHAAQYIKTLSKSIRMASSALSTNLDLDQDKALDYWAKDLIRVVGRFGNVLLQDPTSIYNNIIPLCPRRSMINRTYGNVGGLSIDGMSADTWDDCLARMDLEDEDFDFQVRCTGSYVVTVGRIYGSLIVWNAESCEETRRLKHGEHLSAVGCSALSPLVATAGMRTLRVWDVATGEEIYCLQNPHHGEAAFAIRVLALSFHADDKELLVGYADSAIYCVDLENSHIKWRFTIKEPGNYYQRHLPYFISISPDGYYVLAACSEKTSNTSVGSECIGSRTVELYPAYKSP